MSTSSFNKYLTKLKKFLGEPGSHYPLERVRWTKEIDGIEVEIFLINKTRPGWMNSVLFEDYLISHPKALEEYKILKENLAGVSTKEYYRNKIEFMNKILAQIKSS